MEDIMTQPPVGGDDQQTNHIAGVIEALLFVNEKPVTLDQIKGALETVGAGEIKKAIDVLRDVYAARQSGVMVVEIAGGYQMLSNPLYATYLRNFFKTKQKEKLSKPSLETLAIMAYKQPVTRADVELIRGVNSDGVVAHLLEKELVKVVGRKDVPGRPYLYGTTRQFLEYFGLKSLSDLPTLDEFPALQPSLESGILDVGGRSEYQGDPVAQTPRLPDAQETSWDRDESPSVSESPGEPAAQNELSEGGLIDDKAHHKEMDPPLTEQVAKHESEESAQRN